MTSWIDGSALAPRQTKKICWIVSDAPIAVIRKTSDGALRGTQRLVGDALDDQRHAGGRQPRRPQSGEDQEADDAQRSRSSTARPGVKPHALSVK